MTVHQRVLQATMMVNAMITTHSRSVKPIDDDHVDIDEIVLSFVQLFFNSFVECCSYLFI